MLKATSLVKDSIPYVSVLVLNYNGKHFLKECFSSLMSINYPKSKFEVIMVDNGSTDDSVKYVRTNFPNVRIILLNQNFGFGGGNNRGVKFARGNYIVFLNNDTKVTENWLSELVEASLCHFAPICASKTLFMKDNEIIEYGGGKFTINGRGYSIDMGKANDSEKDCYFTGYPCAASMLIKKDVFIDLNGFDEDYFACLDDTDLGWRAWLFGYSVLYCPASVVYHEAGGTTGKGRLSPLKAFHGTKDPLITVLKDLELKNIFFGLALAFGYDLIEFYSLVKKRNLKCIKNKFLGYSWVIQNLKRILCTRRIIQNKRVCSDRWLRNMHFLTFPLEAFKEYRRLSKFSPDVQSRVIHG